MTSKKTTKKPPIKTPPWLKIKVDYLSGMTPKELAGKYALTSKKIRDKAASENWLKERRQLSAKIVKKAKDSILEQRTKALEDLAGDADTMLSNIKTLINLSVAKGDVHLVPSLTREYWRCWDKKLRSLNLPEKITKTEHSGDDGNPVTVVTLTQKQFTESKASGLALLDQFNKEISKDGAM